ncbi:hypothetical protein VYU27_007711 [Nannochloropsis oceanica]
MMFRSMDVATNNLTVVSSSSSFLLSRAASREGRTLPAAMDGIQATVIHVQAVILNITCNGLRPQAMAVA